MINSVVWIEVTGDEVVVNDQGRPRVQCGIRVIIVGGLWKVKGIEESL
jgi:hypothetical protein